LARIRRREAGMTDDNHNSGDPLGWPDDYLMTRKQASAFARAHGIRLAASTLAKKASRADGPPITDVLHRVYYAVGPFRAWLNGQKHLRRV
jgi:hypothetical protein